MYFLMLNILRVLVGIYISSAIICTCTIKEPCEALWTKSDNNSTWIQTWIPLGNSVMTGLAPESICGPPSCNAFVTVRKRSCGKVKFSQACVKNSVHRRGGVHPPGRPPPPPEQTPPQAPPPPQETATAADGTHPTGMHSCSINLCHNCSGQKKTCLLPLVEDGRGKVGCSLEMNPFIRLAVSFPLIVNLD